MPTNFEIPIGHRVRRYTLHEAIASGGMASVYFGRLSGAAGFRRTVAVKRLHPQYLAEADFVTQFVDEARLAAYISHPNVVQTHDVVSTEGELLLVMEYIHGETLARLLTAMRERRQHVPIAVATTTIAQALRGLHAAHEACDELGQHIGIVHRDVSPQNIVIGCDGVARVLDFGIAQARLLVKSTDGSQLKGKVRYMAPEQVQMQTVDRRTDVFAAGVVLWRALTSQHLFGHGDTASIARRVLYAQIQPPSAAAAHVPKALDTIVLKALARNPEKRFQTAAEFADALEQQASLLSAHQLGEWVSEVAHEALAARREVLNEITRRPSMHGRADQAVPSPSYDPQAGIPTEVPPPDEPHTDNLTGGGWLASLKPPRRKSSGLMLAFISAAALAVGSAALHLKPNAASPGEEGQEPELPSVIEMDRSPTAPAPDEQLTKSKPVDELAEPARAEVKALRKLPRTTQESPLQPLDSSETPKETTEEPAKATKAVPTHDSLERAAPKYPAAAPRDPLSRRK